MGGQGSGRPRSYSGRKTTVEDGLVLSIGAVKDLFLHGTGSSGTISWTRGENISVQTVADGDGVALRFFYTVGKGAAARAMNYRVPVVKVVPHFGGVRWYFLCPLSHNGTPCRRRGDKLYLPPGDHYFGCRTCYGLTYESAQEAHRFDGLYKVLAANIGRGATPAEVKRLLSRPR